MTHRGDRRLFRRGWSVPARALLALGAVGLLGATSTYAYWTDDVAITGITFTSGVLDLRVNDGDSYAATALGMAGMVPASTSAQILTVKNNGTVPLKYTLVGGLGGTDAPTLAAASALRLTISTGATVSGTTLATACSGGTIVYGPTPLTAVITTPVIGTRRGPLAAGASENLCFQITFDANAASTLQGKTATATFTFTGTSDVS